MLNYAETTSTSTIFSVESVPCSQSQNILSSPFSSIMSAIDPTYQFPLFRFGNVTVTLDNDEFRRAFFNGRRYYYSDIAFEFPERATTLTAIHAFSQITVHDRQTEHYHLDAEGIAHPVEVLGVFFGYITAPLLPESEEEQQQRQMEEASYILITEPVSGA